MNHVYAGLTDIGIETESQEDYICCLELDEKNLLCVIADGTTSIEGQVKPAILAAETAANSFKRMYDAFEKEGKKKRFLSYPLIYLKETFIHANEVMNVLKIGNEKRYAGYMAAMTAVLIRDDQTLFYMHSGNTRAYVLRMENGASVLRQITEDMTHAKDLLRDGKIDELTYYGHPGRMTLTGAVGAEAELNVTGGSLKLSSHDIILMSTDGIHYAIREEYIKEFILKSGNCTAAAESLIRASRDEVKYPDNMAALIIQPVWEE